MRPPAYSLSQPASRGSILHTNSSAADEQTSSVIDDTVSGDEGPITGDEANPTFGEADITDSTPVSETVGNDAGPPNHPQTRAP